jgi:adenylyltransferase/sulfurtransferase
MTPFERMTWDQDYLKEKHILLIGCGGLAHAALPYLLSSGIGKATLFDGDAVESSNLNRQHLFTPKDVGKNKAAVLKNYCSVHFPASIIVSEERMFEPQAEKLTTFVDLVFDFTDRLATKLALASRFEKLRVPYFYSAAQMNAGSSAFIHLNSITSDMLFGHVQDASKVERDCTVDGVWPTVVAAVGIHVAHQALQFLTLSPCAFVGAIDYYDGISGLWTRFHFNPNQEKLKPVSSIADLLKDRSTPIFFLGERDSLPSEIISVTASELKDEIDSRIFALCASAKTGLRRFRDRSQSPRVSPNCGGA